MRTLKTLVVEGKRILAETPFNSSPREASWILSRLLGWSEAQLMARNDRPASPSISDRYRKLLAQRASGRPMAYLFGTKEFWGREFWVDERVLIPRPETEHLIELALRIQRPSGQRILDLGTGSGCIAITLALEQTQTKVLALDRSLASLAVARSNALRLQAENVSFAQGSWAASLKLDSIGLIVANPPYIDEGLSDQISPEITRYEPHEALFAAESGLASYRQLLQSLSHHSPRATCLLEIGSDQGASLRSLAKSIGWRVDCIHQDLAGHDRIAELRPHPPKGTVIGSF